ncbi:unnamed protein product, partial [Musa textilis]
DANVRIASYLYLSYGYKHGDNSAEARSTRERDAASVAEPTRSWTG